MAGGVGNLSVGLSLDYAEYTAGLTKAQRQAELFASQAKATFAGAFAAGFAADFVRGLVQIPGALAGVVKGAIDAADHLNDLSKKTGIAADTLGGIGFAAKQAGGDLESAAAGIGKLNKSIAEAAAGSQQAAEGFAVIGVAVKDADGATRNADAVLSDVADKFASFSDGPEKAALALRLFGKAGAEMIPLLNDGGAALQGNIAFFKRYSGVTVETAKAADQFNDTLAKIALLTHSFATTIASELLGPMQAVATRFLEAKEAGSGFAGVASIIKGAFVGIATAASFTVETISATSTVLTGLIERAQSLNQAAARARQSNPLDVTGSSAIFDKQLQAEFKAIAQAQDDGVKAARTRHERLVAALTFTDDPTNFSNEGRNQAVKQKPAPRLLPIGGAAGLDDPTKKLLDARLKAIDAQIEQEKDLFQTRNRFLDLYNSQNLLSIADYYAGRTAAQAEALRNETDLINQEIALVRAHQGTKGLSKTGQAEDEVKLQELIGKRTKVEQQAGEQTIFLAAQSDKAYKELADQILGVNAQVLDLQENFAQAAAIKFDLQFDALSKTFTANGNTAGTEALAILRAAAIAQGALQKATLDSGRTLEALSIQEDRINLAVQTGSLTSLEALVREGDARKRIIPVYEAQVEALAAIAKASGRQIDLDNLERARLALDKLKASADPLAESLNKTFGGDFNTALDDFVTGTKSASEAFHSFAKSVLNDILKMGSKSITESIFGGSGGAGGFLSDLFKGAGGGAGGTAGGGGLFGSGLGGIFRSLSGSQTSGGASVSLDTQGVGLDAQSKGFNAAKDSQQAFEDLSAATAAQTAAAGASTVGLESAATSLTSFSSNTSLAATALALFQAITSSSATASAAGWIGKIAGIFGGSSGGADTSGPQFASLAGISGGRAAGGPVGPWKAYTVGEHGPETLQMGSQAGTIIANKPAEPSKSYTFNVNVQGAPNQSRDSAMQQGAAIGQGIQKAMARNL